MHIQKIVIVCLILTCIVAISCQKIEDTRATANLKFEQIKSPDSIPDEFGKLIGVTMSPAYADWGQLWFEKPDKTIVVVRVQWVTGYIAKQALVIPRR